MMMQRLGKLRRVAGSGGLEVSKGRHMVALEFAREHPDDPICGRFVKLAGIDPNAVTENVLRIIEDATNYILELRDAMTTPSTCWRCRGTGHRQVFVETSQLGGEVNGHWEDREGVCPFCNGDGLYHSLREWYSDERAEVYKP